MGNEAFNFFGSAVMEEFVNGRQLFDREEAPIQEEIGKFEKVGQERDKPAQPRQPGEGPARLKEKKDQKNRGGKIGSELLKKSGLATFDFFGQALADVPVGDIVLDKMGDDNQGNGQGRVAYLGGDKGTGDGVGDR